MSRLATESPILVDPLGIYVTMRGKCKKVIGACCDGCEYLWRVENWDGEVLNK
jgi:hypothetical protein